MPWFHTTPLPEHPVDADFDCSTLGFPARFAVAGDFDGDGKVEIAIALDAKGSAGNDFWVMKYNTKTNAWEHMSPLSGHPMEAD
ncbi:MAG: hypothetical protein IH851_12160, partial [Armatimonadetes bacterium]|nr:hypothetical protein [Armatimonadota bacterium]